MQLEAWNRRAAVGDGGHTDSERLDWLEANKETFIPMLAVVRHDMFAPTVRAIIDHAQNAQVIQGESERSLLDLAGTQAEVGGVSGNAATPKHDAERFDATIRHVIARVRGMAIAANHGGIDLYADADAINEKLHALREPAAPLAQPTPLSALPTPASAQQ